MSSASPGTTGTPSVGHHMTASHAPATERPLPASASSPCPRLPLPEMPSALSQIPFLPAPPERQWPYRSLTVSLCMRYTFLSRPQLPHL